METEEANKRKLDLILSETTGISVAVMVLVIAASVYIVSIKGATIANAHRARENTTQHERFLKAYIEHTRIMDEGMGDIRGDIGEIKGMLKVLTERKFAK